MRINFTLVALEAGLRRVLFLFYVFLRGGTTLRGDSTTRRLFAATRRLDDSSRRLVDSTTLRGERLHFGCP